MSTELKQYFDEMASTWQEMKSAMNVRDEEIKQIGAASQETKNYLSRLNDRLDELEAKLNAPTTKSVASQGAAADLEIKEAMLTGLRYGHNAMTPEQQKAVKIVSLTEAKALNMSSDTAGGYLAYPELASGIIKESLPFSPIRSLATVRQTSNRSIQFRKRTGTFAARWVGETEQRSETAGLQYDLEEIATHEMYADVPVSEQLLEDNAFDLENEIMLEAGEQFGIAEGKAFVQGNSPKQPEGLLVNPYIKSIPSGDAANLTGDGLVTMFYDLLDVYAANATWLMQRNTVRNVRLLKDSMGNSLWERSLALGAPPTILGAPYVEAIDMDPVGAGTYPILFGDFRRAYIIVDRVSMVVKRLNELGAKIGIIEFMVRKRVGGQVILPQALRKMKISVS